jgi:hypothetical protein
MEEGRVGGAPAVRLILGSLLRAELIFAPAVEPAHVIVRPGRSIVGRCDDAGFIAAGRVHHAMPRARREDGFLLDREEMAALYDGNLVALLLCSARADVTGQDLRVLRQFVDRVQALSSDNVSSGGEAPPQPPPAVFDSAPTRQWLDAHREAILGCAGRATVVVRVEPAGVSLQPPLAGTPEEECVRAALGAPPRAAVPTGSVIHAVH